MCVFIHSLPLASPIPDLLARGNQKKAQAFPGGTRSRPVHFLIPKVKTDDIFFSFLSLGNRVEGLRNRFRFNSQKFTNECRHIRGGGAPMPKPKVARAVGTN